MSILWNGECLDWINPTRGIRQGDPVSFYIFVLCMERLGHIINKVASGGEWKPIKLSRLGPPLSHLFFADDLILFTKASVEQLKVVLDCLNLFMDCSGQKVNYQKSQLFVSKNVDINLTRQLSQISRIPLISKLGRYLGVNSIHGIVTQDLFSNVVESITCRLEGWKMKILSSVGRQVLVRSVLNTVPFYTMQTTLIPMGICYKIEMLMRRFLWGGTSQQRATSLVSCDKVTTSIDWGGIYYRRSKVFGQMF